LTESRGPAQAGYLGIDGMYCVWTSRMATTVHQPQPQADPESLVSPPKVLYIAGMTRSGTTLLSNLLNELPSFVAVGEVRTYWKAMREPRLCGCGATVADCTFWTDVAEWIERHGGPLPVDRARSLLDEHVRSLPLQLARLARASESDYSPAKEYAQLLQRLYEGIGAVGGAEVVVDSSKGPHDAYTISKFTDLDVFVVHLVRDPRAVAYSVSRRVKAPDRPGGYLVQQQAPEVGVRWMARNALSEVLLARRLGPRYMRLRYEDLVDAPAQTIERISAMCTGRKLPLPLSDNVISLGPNHSVAGNPKRHNSGPTRIRSDDEWTKRMARGPMLGATISTVPLLRRYGYPVRARQ
jgi:hypothetical protein